MSVWRNENRLEPSRILVDQNRVVQYRKDPPPEGAKHGEFGLNLFQKQIIAQHQTGSFPISDYFDLLAPQKQLFAWETKQRFYEIGCPEGILDTERLLTINSFNQILAAIKGRETKFELDHSAYQPIMVKSN